MAIMTTKQPWVYVVNPVTVMVDPHELSCGGRPQRFGRGIEHAVLVDFHIVLDY